MKETDIGRAVVSHFSAAGYDVYQEVQPRWGDRIADVVIEFGPALWVVECKTSFRWP